MMMIFREVQQMLEFEIFIYSFIYCLKNDSSQLMN